MGVESDLLPANRPEAGSSTTRPPDPIELATRRISQFEGQSENPTRHSRRGILRILESVALLSALGAAYKLLSGEKASAQVEDKGVGSNYTRTYTDNLGNRIVWRVLNGTDGVLPNNPDHSIDKIFVAVNDSEAMPFQFNETHQFPPDTNHIAVGGHWMDTKLNIAYVPLVIEKNSTGGKTYPYIGIVLDAKNAFKSPVLDLSKQKLITELPQGGTDGDSFKYFKVDSDNNGMFIKFGIQQSINPKENGDYMVRLDNNGLPVGKPVKIESVIMSRRGFIPFLGNAYTGK